MYVAVKGGEKAIDAQFGQIGIASASALLQGVGGVDRLLAPFHCNVNQHNST